MEEGVTVCAGNLFQVILSLPTFFFISAVTSFFM